MANRRCHECGAWDTSKLDQECLCSNCGSHSMISLERYKSDDGRTCRKILSTSEREMTRDQVAGVIMSVRNISYETACLLAGTDYSYYVQPDGTEPPGSPMRQVFRYVWVCGGMLNVVPREIRKGHCRRHAPRPRYYRGVYKDEGEAIFPETKGTDWCKHSIPIVREDTR